MFSYRSLRNYELFHTDCYVVSDNAGARLCAISTCIMCWGTNNCCAAVQKRIKCYVARVSTHDK